MGKEKNLNNKHRFLLYWIILIQFLQKTNNFVIFITRYIYNKIKTFMNHSSFYE